MSDYFKEIKKNQKHSLNQNLTGVKNYNKKIIAFIVGLFTLSVVVKLGGNVVIDFNLIPENDEESFKILEITRTLADITLIISIILMGYFLIVESEKKKGKTPEKKIGLSPLNQLKNDFDKTKKKISNLSIEGVPSEIMKWNWAAFFLNWIWGTYHRVWISYLVFVPFINIFAVFYLGIKGNELAWRANSFTSVQEFLDSQKKWQIAAILIVLGTFLVFYVLLVEENNVLFGI